MARVSTGSDATIDQDFTSLVSERRRLRELCSYHVQSVLGFRMGEPPHCISFRKLLDENESDDQGKVRHLTNTTTCIESLLDAGHDCGPAAVEFARRALERDPESWKSEKSAEVYARCRTLPLVIDHAPSQYSAKLESHVRWLLDQLNDGSRLAIGEKRNGEDGWLPPNAFHTYWVLQTLNRFERKCSPGPDFLKLIASKRRLMLEWARQQLGIQNSLHATKSSELDSDQLGWILAICFRFLPQEGGAEQRELVLHGLECLFSTQDPTGGWRNYRPLFAYQSAGNAYSYVFETFGQLLCSALLPESRQLKDALRPYSRELFSLAIYADSTAVRHQGGRVWASQHRVDKTGPEGWATASVYTFLQAMRKIWGTWTRAAALEQLPHSVAQAPANPMKALEERGDCWKSANELSVGERLVINFVNPILRARELTRVGGDDPDYMVIGENQARGAILFGPPGSSKTTLARALAHAIGWDFVELHANHFVSNGMHDILRTADGIFSRLRELDRCVVFFDEIDELVRTREGASEAFGRFLTTSMLPKLQELWEQRRVVYIVATNHIAYFDGAIKRSQRFDVLAYVSQPSLGRKIGRLKKVLSDKYEWKNPSVVLEPKAVEEAIGLLAAGQSGSALAKLLPMRWDELDELAARLHRAGIGEQVKQHELAAALLDMDDERLSASATYCEHRDNGAAARRDYRMEVWWRRVEAQGNDGTNWQRSADEQVPAGFERTGFATVQQKSHTVTEQVSSPKDAAGILG